MRLLHGPTFFEVSRIATKQLLALAHVMKFLPLADTLELANRGVIYESNFVWANSVQDSQLGLAHQVHNSATRGCLMGPHYLELAGWLPDKPLALAHSLNCCPLLVHSCRPTAAVTNHLQALGRADFIRDNGLKLAHQVHNDAI